MIKELSGPKNRFSFTVLMVLGFLGFGITFALPLDRVAGVKPGEWIEYTIEWEDCPYSVYQTKVRREIVGCNGSSLNVNLTIWWSNGTVTTETRIGDVSEGTGSSTMIFIPANLSIGDTVYIEGFDPAIIKGEEEREYLGFRRKVVYSEFISRGFYVLIYWDKIKGVAVEINIKHVISEVERTYDYALNVSISGTNMFTQLTNHNMSFEWIFLLLMVAIIALFLTLRKRHNSKKGCTSKGCVSNKVIFTICLS